MTVLTMLFCFHLIVSVALLGELLRIIFYHKRTTMMGTKPTRGPAAPMPSHSAMIAAKLIKENNNDE
jgi:hypothetical protein